ncbi:MAG: hypothetical protein PHY02_00390 [Phycisphaerae bacterium]|nr:hypothetical protein [Phycisphaerae bacterium]
MNYRSKKILSCPPKRRRIFTPAFSLVEAVTALIILALISSSVLVVINRCMASAADSVVRMQAFEVARDNMEALLSKDAVEETTEYGTSDKYPQVQWETTVEAFYEPAEEQIWVQAVCSAEYPDSQGQTQSLELTHWLTALTKDQLIQMIEDKQDYGLDDVNEPNEPAEPNDVNKPDDANNPANQDTGMIFGYTREELKDKSLDELYLIWLNGESQ